MDTDTLGGLRHHPAVVCEVGRNFQKHLIALLRRLYDFYPQGNEDLLIETMELLKWNGDPWEGGLYLYGNHNATKPNAFLRGI